MILEVSTTYRPATDLGSLLHKNPARAQSFDLASDRSRCEFALESEPVDPRL